MARTGHRKFLALALGGYRRTRYHRGAAAQWNGPKCMDKPRRLLVQRPAKWLVLLLGLDVFVGGCPRLFAQINDPVLMNQQVIKLYHEGKYPAAIAINETLLAILKKEVGPENPVTARSLNNLGELYRAMGDYAKAEPLYRQALQIYQKVFGLENPMTVTILNNLAELYRVMGDYPKAEPLDQQALQIRNKMLGSEHPDTAESLNNLACLYRDMGDYPKAEPLYRQALQIYQKVCGLENPLTATTLNNLAVLYVQMGDYAKAEPLHQQALQIRKKILGPEHPDTAQSLNNLAVLYSQLGDYATAESFYQQVVQICTRAFGPEHPNTAQSLNNLAEVYRVMGDYAKAEPLHQQALQIRKKMLGLEHPDTAASLNNLASLYEDIGDYVKAEPLLQQALEIMKKTLGPEHPNTAQSLSILGVLYYFMGDYAKAEPLYQQAHEIYKKVFGPEHPYTVTSLNNLAELYRAMGDYAKAEQLFQQALEIGQKVPGSVYPDTAAALINFAFLKFDRGQILEAKSVGERSAEADLSILSMMLSFASEQQRLAYENTINPYSLFAVLKGSEDDLASAILRYKGVVLDSIIEDRLLAEASQGSEDQKLVEQLNLDKRQLGQLLLQPPQKLSAETNQQIETLEREVEKIESRLAQHVSGLGRARRALTVTDDQVQVVIPKDEALIEYLRYWHYLGRRKYEQRYGAIVLFSKGAPLWIPLGKANEIEPLVQRYATLVRSSPQEEELSANLQALYEALWAPIGQALPSQTKKVTISPDGELNFISFATLLTKDNQFLAQRYSVHYVASGRDLLRELKPSIAREAVLFANPAFDLASTAMLAKADHRSSNAGSIRGSEKMEIEDWSFGSLEGTQKERDELIKKFAGWGWTPCDFTAKEATKNALLKIHSPYILHLATHGFFAKEDPTATQTGPQALLNVRQSVTKSKFFKNPMHRSGLALAGAQTTIEAWKREEVPLVENDGILTAEDVSTLDLQGTWLVTLSACDTGSGEARAGEGVMGLRRGFIQAGARNLLMTLWPISDEITVRIMSDFYEAAHKSGNAPEALAEVQQDWLVALRDGKGEKFDKVKQVLNRHGLATAVRFAGPFILSAQGRP
jgi:tetratricopeptide (TPR) repeat protein